jgi:hypothetical protein
LPKNSNILKFVGVALLAVKDAARTGTSGTLGMRFPETTEEKRRLLLKL